MYGYQRNLDILKVNLMSPRQLLRILNIVPLGNPILHYEDSNIHRSRKYSEAYLIQRLTRFCHIFFLSCLCQSIFNY